MKNLKKISEVLPSNEVLKPLENFRSEIDSIDQKLIELFDQRAALVFKVGEWKKKNSYEVHDPNREQQILNKIVRSNRKNLKDSELQTLFTKMIEFYRTTEKARSLIQHGLDCNQLPKQGSFGFFGFGLIGASVALSLKEQFPGWNFLIHDPNIKINEFELWNKTKASSIFQIANFDQLKDLDFLFLAAPIDVNFEQGLKLVKKNKITLNLGSYQDHIKDVIGFHPLAGKETSGYQAAQADLFYGKTICITHFEFTPHETLEQIKALANILGSEITTTDNEIHNKSLAYSSHLVQLLSMVLGLTLEKNNFSELTALIPNTAKEFLRLNGSDFKMWEPILRKNQKYILTALTDFEKNLKEVKVLISAEANHDQDLQEVLPLKNSFRKANSHFSNIRELFSKGHQIYESIYHKRKAK